MSPQDRWYWFRLQLATGERCTVWTTTARDASRWLARWQRAGVRLVTRGRGGARLAREYEYAAKQQQPRMRRRA